MKPHLTSLIQEALSILVVIACISTVSIQAEPLKIATGEYPPWTSKELAHGGFMNLIVKKAFAEHGIEVQFDYMPWNRALELVKLAKYPASSFWGFDPERKGDFLYSDKIQHDPIVFFYNKHKTLPEWQTLADLKDFRFGATRGYTYTPGFWQLAKSHVLRISIANDDVANLQKLINGDIDAFPISELTGKYLLKKHFKGAGMDKIAVNNHPINSSEDFLLVSGDWPDAENLVSTFNSGLQKLKERGEMSKLREEFFAICCNE